MSISCPAPLRVVVRSSGPMPLVSKLAYGARVAPETGPFAALDDVRRTLVVADIENWAYSARDLDQQIDFAALADLLKRRLPRTELHGVLSVDTDDLDAARLEGAAHGWIAHPRAIFTSATRRHANADTLFACATTALLARRCPTAVILGTGDGALGVDVARFIRQEFPSCQFIATLSLAGSTSHLLDARCEPAIDTKSRNRQGRDAPADA